MHRTAQRRPLTMVCKNATVRSDTAAHRTDGTAGFDRQMASVPPEWEETQSDRFYRVVGDIHESANAVEATYADVIRAARRRLGVVGLIEPRPAPLVGLRHEMSARFPFLLLLLF